MNEPRRLTRRLAVVAAAATLGAGAGAGVYAAVDGGDSHTAAAPVAAAHPAALTKSTALSITDIYKQASPGVVDITVSGVATGGGLDPFGPSQRRTEGEGSGFVLDKGGHIVTNQHVVAGANSITVHFANGKDVKASIVGTDDSSDLAVLKVDVAASQLAPLTLGNSSGVDPGEGVVAIGSPFGLPGTITSGIVSATGRRIQAPNGFPIVNAIQTDAAINHGNSGGPLLDATGVVIGVNAQIDSDSGGNDGVGFAIPVNTVKTVTSQLISGGKVEHAFLGVQIRDANGGALLSTVQSGTPAAKAGLKAGDVITVLDGKAIRSSDALSTAIAAHKPGDKVTVTVKRGGSTKRVEVTLGTRSS